jgi:hypothetical protein
VGEEANLTEGTDSKEVTAVQSKKGWGNSPIFESNSCGEKCTANFEVCLEWNQDIFQSKPFKWKAKKKKEVEKRWETAHKIKWVLYVLLLLEFVEEWRREPTEKTALFKPGYKVEKLTSIIIIFLLH